MAEEFTWVPSYGSEKKTVHRVRKSSYGDGYEQTVEDGLNSTYQEWSLVFRTTTEIANQIDEFLSSHKGTRPFLWTPPHSNRQIVVKCEKEHSRSFSAYNDETITATFTQKFGERV